MELNLDLLLSQMKAGDREAAAVFMDHFGPRLRRRISGRMRASMRRLFDSQDILSTVARRLDAVVRRRSLKAESVGELCALVLCIGENSLIEKTRLFLSLERREGPDAPFAKSVLSRLRTAEERSRDGAEEAITQAFAALDDPIDRQILTFWLLDHNHGQIAEFLGMSHAAVRKRWQVIRERLRDSMGDVT